MIVDGQMQVFPADASALALSFAIAGNPVPGALETAELFDIDMDQLAGTFALIAAHRLGRFQRRDGAKPQSVQHATDRCRRNPEIARDLLAGKTLAPKRFDLLCSLSRG